MLKLKISWTGSVNRSCSFLVQLYHLGIDIADDVGYYLSIDIIGERLISPPQQWENWYTVKLVLNGHSQKG